MGQNRKQTRRGIHVRRLMVRAAQVYQRHGRPLPSQQKLAIAVGINCGQCHHHFSRLIREGWFSVTPPRKGVAYALISVRAGDYTGPAPEPRVPENAANAFRSPAAQGDGREKEGARA